MGKPETSADWEQGKLEKPKTYLCWDGLIGCRQIFTKEEFRFSHAPGLEYFRESTLCKACERTIGLEWGVSPLDAGAVGVVLQNMAYYYSKIPGSQNSTLRERVRPLLQAAGVQINNATSEESSRASFLRSKFTALGAGYKMPELESVPSVPESSLPVGDRL